MPHKRYLVPALCVVCREPFIATAYGGGLRRKSCSSDCRRLIQRPPRVMPGARNPKWKGGRPEWTCRHCGARFNAYRKKRGAPRLFCSTSCANTAHGRDCGDNMRSRLRFENEAVDVLTSEGWSCLRSAGSRGPFDVIAVNGTGVLLVQVKSTKRMGTSSTLSMLCNAIEGMQAMPHRPGGCSAWLFVRELRGAWHRECVDGYPTNRDELRERVRQLVRRWRDRQPAPDVKEL